MFAQTLQGLYRSSIGLDINVTVDDNEYGNWQQVNAMKLAFCFAQKASTRRLKQLPFEFTGDKAP